MSKIVQVDFHGEALWAAERDGDVLVAVKPICEALGVQWAAQLKRIKRDAVMREGMSMMDTPSAGGEQKAICLPLRLLNGWLFGIDERRVKDDAHDKVLRYKRECYEVLFRHFHGVAQDALTGDVCPDPLPDDGSPEFDRSDLRTFVALVAECRNTWGRPAAQRLWRQLPLPQPDAPALLAGPLSQEEGWWRRRLETGNLLPDRPGWPAEVLCDDLFDAAWNDLPMSARSYGRAAMMVRLGRVLHAHVPGLRRRRASNLGGGRPWVYVLPPLEVCRSAY